MMFPDFGPKSNASHWFSSSNFSGSFGNLAWDVPLLFDLHVHVETCGVSGEELQGQR